MSPSRQSASVFVLTFVALMLLLALTVEAARHDLGRWNFAVATLIATCKAVLIMLYFMQVRRSIEITKLVVCAGFFWLAILFTLSLADYWTRSWLVDDQLLSYDEFRRPVITSPHA
jgi:cytochrome c oxidase subunit 4